MLFTFFSFKKAFAEKMKAVSVSGLPLCKHTSLVVVGVLELSGQNICAENLVLIKQLSDMFSPVSCRAPATATETFGLCGARCATHSELSPKQASLYSWLITRLISALVKMQ